MSASTEGVKRYWMESEGVMGQRIDTDDSSVEVVLASDFDATVSRLQAELATMRECYNGVLDAGNKALAELAEAKASLSIANDESRTHYLKYCRSVETGAELVRQRDTARAQLRASQEALRNLPRQAALGPHPHGPYVFYHDVIAALPKEVKSHD
jgi:hypothetical protein